MGDSLTQPIRAWREGDDRRARMRARERETEALFAPGSRFGRFELGAQLGAGGMGVVIEAIDPHLARKVAIKMLRPSQAGGDAQARMLVEARALARLTHPNVVTVHEVGIEDDVVYVVMELVQGETLASFLKTRRGWRELVRVFVAAGRGLAAAHAAGVVHRDFKPSNVMVDRDGRVRVVDFGVCDLAEATTPRGDGGTGLLIGTPAYMAPEQIDAREVDARADQFAFCVCLFEALYGRRPFTGDGLEEVRAAMHAPIPPPEASGVPDRLGEVLVRGLAIDPADRFADLDTLLAELERDPARRARRIAGTAGVLSLVALGAVGWLRQGPETPTSCGEPAPLWDSTRDGALARHAATLRPGELPAAISHRLGDYATRWLAAHRQVCANPASDARTLAEACLYRLRDQFLMLSDMLATTPDPLVIDGGAAAAASLTAPRSCRTEAARVATAAPTSPAVQRAIDHAEALARAGRYRDARAELDAALAPPEVAATASYAHAELVRGEVAIKLSDGPSAEASLRRAAIAAAAQGDDELVARAYVALMFALSYVEDRAADALAIAPFAEAAVARAGNPAELRARLALQLGSAHIELAHYDDAQLALARADRIWTDELDPEDLEHARVLNAMANVAGYRGRPIDAIAMYRRALAIREGALGKDHPDLASILSNLGDAQIAIGEYADAGVTCARVVRIAREDVERAGGLACQGAAAHALGQLDTAVELIGRAEAMLADRPVGNHRYYLQVELGEVQLDRGDLALATTWCERARATFGELGDHPDAARVLACVGRIALARADREAARTALERAHTLLGATPPRERWVDALELARARTRE